MPYFHCNKCHHEFEGYPEKKGTECTPPKCGWCGADSYVTEEKTPLEKMGEEIERMGVDKFFERLDILEESLAAGVFNEKTKTEG